MKLSKINEIINRPKLIVGDFKIVIGEMGYDSEVWFKGKKIDRINSVNININVKTPTLITLEIYNTDGVKQTIEGIAKFYNNLSE